MLAVGFEPTKPKHGILRPAPLTAREYQLRRFAVCFQVKVWFILTCWIRIWSSALRGARTLDRQLIRLPLYQLSYKSLDSSQGSLSSSNGHCGPRDSNPVVKNIVFLIWGLDCCVWTRGKVVPGFEPGLLDSKSRVLTNWTIQPETSVGRVSIIISFEL